MALIKCPHCGLDVSDRASVCPHCKQRLTPNLSRPPSVAGTASPVPPTSMQESPVPPTPVVEKKSGNKGLIILLCCLAGALLIGGGIFGYFYFSSFEEAVPTAVMEEPTVTRYYTFAYSVRMRSTPNADSKSNIIGTYSYGTELIVSDSSVNGWYYGRITTGGGKEGYVSAPYLLNKPNFTLLNSIFGNDNAKKMLSESRYRRSLLEYFKGHRYIGNLSAEEISNAGLDPDLASAEQWQVYCNDSKAYANNVDHSAKRYRRSSKYNDLAVIIQNIRTGERRLLYFYYDSDETSHLLCEQSVSNSGYIYSLQLRESYDGYYVDVDYAY